MKILSGVIEPQKGFVTMPKTERMAVLEQDHFKYDEYTVMETVIMGHKRLHEIMKEKERLCLMPDSRSMSSTPFRVMPFEIYFSVRLRTMQRTAFSLPKPFALAVSARPIWRMKISYPCGSFAVIEWIWWIT